MKLYMTLLFLPMAVLANDSQAFHRQKSSANGLRKAVQKSLETRQSTGSDYCSGPGVTCQSCFGSGYIQCPGDSFTCYKPGDPEYGSCSEGDSEGSDSSSSGSDGDTTTSPEYVPSSTSSSYSPASSSSGSDYCYGKSCTGCFGPGYLDCPGGSTYCYNPSDPEYSTCPSGTGSSGSAPSSGAFPTAVGSSTSSWSFTDSFTPSSTPFTTTDGGSEPTSSSATFGDNSSGATTTGSSSVAESNDGSVVIPMSWNIGVGAMAMVAIFL
ncbi:hypothetical protein Plec18170_004303 [Paecilomyces lecythidis]